MNLWGSIKFCSYLFVSKREEMVSCAQITATTRRLAQWAQWLRYRSTTDESLFDSRRGQKGLFLHRVQPGSVVTFPNLQSAHQNWSRLFRHVTIAILLTGAASQSKCWLGTQIPRCTSHAALPMVTWNISPYTNVILTFDFGLDHPVHGGYGRGGPTPWRRSNFQTKKLKSDHGPYWGPSTKMNWPTDHSSQYNLKFNLRHWTANYRPVLTSERAPYMRKKENNCHSKTRNMWSPAPKGARHQDQLADWPSVAISLELGVRR
jgi:hypothetical protein